MDVPSYDFIMDECIIAKRMNIFSFSRLCSDVYASNVQCKQKTTLAGWWNWEINCWHQAPATSAVGVDCLHLIASEWCLPLHHWTQGVLSYSHDVVTCGQNHYKQKGTANPWIQYMGFILIHGSDGYTSKVILFLSPIFLPNICWQ